jgi:hypothetical protein
LGCRWGLAAAAAAVLGCDIVILLLIWQWTFAAAIRLAVNNSVTLVRQLLAVPAQVGST